jgi:CBS domain containing-hemolysin-like protein
MAGERAVAMTDQDVALLVLAALLVPLAGVLAAMDSALVRVSAARVEEMEREGVRKAAVLAQVIADRPRHTNLLLLLRLVCELLATVLVARAVIDWLGSTWSAVALTTSVMVLVSYVLVGVGPRTLGRQHPYRVALATAPLVRTLARVLGPLAKLLIVLGNAITPGRGFREGPFASEIELRELVDLAEQRGVVEHGERDMIHSVFELGDTIAREVMVPRTEVVWIERGKTVRQALALALRSGFSRIPVIGENVDDVVGLVYLKDLAARAQDPRGATTRVEEVMRPAAFVPESKPVDELLREMQARRIHMAIVIDEYGGTAGLVTIEDILEEIVGEIADEYDVERPPVEWLDGDTARVTARMAIEDLGELFGTEVPDAGDVETVGGLLARELGRVPIPGASVPVDGLTLTAESAGGRRNRIDTVLVHREPRPAETPAEQDRDRDRERRPRHPVDQTVES